MTTIEPKNDQNIDLFNENIAKIERLSARLVSAMAQKKPVMPSLEGPSQELFLKATTSYMSEMMNNPARILEHQVAFWGKSLTHYVEAQQKLAKGELLPPADDTPKDRRFDNPLWDTHPYFNYVKQQYLMTSDAVMTAVDDMEGLTDDDRKRVDYFSKQIVDMLAPTNFLATNPDALSKAVETEGQSLVDGLENLVRDIENNDGDLLVSLSDREAFDVGENLATTQGAVVFRNRMFELIQYAPTTPEVDKTPIVLFPPWINKFYVLDLNEKKSLIKWIVDQGHTLFVVSWIDPDATYADTGLEDYIEDGYLTAFDEVKKITGEDQLNAAGYCIAGTTLALTLALMEKRGDTSVKSATFFTTLTDFSDRGEVGVFLDDDFVDGIEAQVRTDGIMRSYFMSRTFSYLRANDLVYRPAIRNYMMGEAPPAFDLLYWNGDATNLPGKMAVRYLRGLCQDNQLAEGAFEILGHTLSLADIQVPICAIACEADHIAAWKSSFAGIKQFGSKDKTFVLSQSGHIAGIVNPVGRDKYGHYLNDDLSLAPDDWKDGAAFTKGSWWPHWGNWLQASSVGKTAPRVPGDSQHPVLCAAPGTYVRGGKFTGNDMK